MLKSMNTCIGQPNASWKFKDIVVIQQPGAESCGNCYSGMIDRVAKDPTAQGDWSKMGHEVWIKFDGMNEVASIIGSSKQTEIRRELMEQHQQQAEYEAKLSYRFSSDVAQAIVTLGTFQVSLKNPRSTSESVTRASTPTWFAKDTFLCCRGNQKGEVRLAGILPIHTRTRRSTQNS